MYARSQIEDYGKRGKELESYSLLEFIMNTYEEKVPQTDESLSSNLSTRGRPRNERSYYLESHPKHSTWRRVIRTAGHNILPDIVGPFFPRHDDPSTEDLYFASVLALLQPWRHLEEIKEVDSFRAAYEAFVAEASQSDLRVIAGIKYYYECKSAAEASDAQDMERPLDHDKDTMEDDLSILHCEDEDIMESNTVEIHLTEDDLKAYEKSRKNAREEDHASSAVIIAKSKNIFADESSNWNVDESISNVHIAHGDDHLKLEHWKESMELNVIGLNKDDEDCFENAEGSSGVVMNTENMDIDEEDDAGTVNRYSDFCAVEEHIDGVDPSLLLKDQRRAYDIINLHLKQSLNGQNPSQLLMIIAGEGGVGKSKTIQSVTENFQKQKATHLLAKGAYTGIAATIIDGKTLHVIAQMSVNGRGRSRKASKKLAMFWKRKQYLIIDEMSMVSRKFLAQISASIADGKNLAGDRKDLPFGGVNVILVGDFHQFPPIAGKSLYWPIDPVKDNAEESLGRMLYEQFKTVVRLKEQVRVVDPEWLDLLHHVRNGSCRAKHIEMLHSLIISNPTCPETNFDNAPWNEAVLITPRHAVRHRWNTSKAHTCCRQQERQLFICRAYDTINGQSLSMSERFTVASKKPLGTKQDERAGLPNSIELSIGMKIMVTFNVETDLDIANGARGEITKIILDEREPTFSTSQSIVQLSYPPAYVLVKLLTTKMKQLQGLDKDIVPLVPLERTFTIVHGTQTKTVNRVQLPLTAAYAFTDYRSQGQTISHAIIDISTPPTGTLTPFNIYVALSRSRGRNNIRLLRDFDEKLLMTHPNEYLRIEDERLARLEAETEKRWEENDMTR